MIGSFIITSYMNFIAYMLFILILQYLCSAHLNLTNKNLIISSAITLSLIVITQFFCPEEFGFYLIYILFYATILVLSYKKITDILLSFVALSIHMTIEIFPIMMVTYLPIPFEDTITVCGLNLSITGIGLDFTLLVLLLSLRMVLNRYHLVLRLNIKEILLSLLLFCFTFMSLVFMKLITDSALLWWVDLFWKIFLFVAFISSIAYYIYTLADSRIRLYHENLSRTQMAYLTTQLDALQYLKEQEQDTQRLRHDLKKHLSIIETLCAEERFDEVRTYSNELGGSFLTTNNPISGNKIADTILATNMKKAETNGITFTFEGSLSKLDTLSAPDICSLLANAYENAMEACTGQTNAYIHTKANTTLHYTSIEIRNSIPKKLRIRNHHLITTKRDKRNHGYGISIMEQIARKYNGECHISSTNSEFILQIIIRH